MNELSIILFGLVPAILWGISDFLYAKGTHIFGSLRGALAVNATGAGVYAVAFMAVLRPHATFDTSAALYTLIASIAFGLAHLSFSKSLEIGPVSLATPISSTYPLIVLFVSLLLFNAPVTTLQILGIIMTVLGVVSATGLLQLKRSDRRLGKGPLFALGAVLGWGIGYSLVIHAMTIMHWSGVFLIEVLVIPLVLVAVMAITGRKNLSPSALAQTFRSPVIWLAGMAQVIGLLILTLGLAKYNSSGVVIVAISCGYPVLTVFLALRHFRESVPLIPLLGGIVGIGGIIVMTLGG